MRKLSFLVIGVTIFFLFSCKEGTASTETIVDQPEETLYWVSIKVTCLKNNNYNPVFCNVEVLKNGKRIEKGSTFIRDGWYVTSRAYFNSTDKVTINILDILTGNLLSGVNNITQKSDPIWFVDSVKKQKTNNPSSDGMGHFYMGHCH